MNLAIDVNNQIHSDFAVTPLSAANQTRDRIAAAVERFCPDNVYCCFDSKNSFRKHLCPDYKAGRERPPGLDEQIEKAYLLLEGRYKCLCRDGFEADDLLATIARQGKTVLWSNDKDIYQCLRDGVVILKSFKGSPREPEWFNEKMLQESFGLTPGQWISYQMLVGDSTDNIKGAPGIGPKTAQLILGEHSLRDLYARLDSITVDGKPLSDAKKTGLRDLESRKDTVWRLVALKTDLDLENEQ